MERGELIRYKTMIDLAKKSNARHDKAMVKRLKLLGINWNEKEARELEKVVLAKKSSKDIGGKPFLTPKREAVEGDLAQVGYCE